MKKLSLPLAVLAGLGVLAGGCSSNTRGDDPAPVYITCEFTLLPAAKSVNDGALMQFTTVTLQSRLKSPTATASSFLDVQVETYTIVWTRIDGGKTASKTEAFGGNLIVPVAGTATLTNYPFMSISALQQPPLSFLWPSNGGVDPETNRTEIRQTGTVTFNGHTMSGQPVASVPAPFNMTFVYIAGAGRVEPVRGR